MINKHKNLELKELEIDITTYTILVTHSVVTEERIAFLLEFLVMVNQYLAHTTANMSEETLDRYYLKIFETHAIHKFLNYHLSQANSLLEWQGIVQTFFNRLNTRNPELIESLSKFAYSEEVSTSIKTKKVVISSNSEEILKLLFNQDSALLRIGMCGSLMLASQVYNRLATLQNNSFTVRDLFYFYLGQENN